MINTIDDRWTVFNVKISIRGSCTVSTYNSDIYLNSLPDANDLY